jgi:hypothetical protein
LGSRAVARPLCSLVHLRCLVRAPHPSAPCCVGAFFSIRPGHGPVGTEAVCRGLGDLASPSVSRPVERPWFVGRPPLGARRTSCPSAASSAGTNDLRRVGRLIRRTSARPPPRRPWADGRTRGSGRRPPRCRRRRTRCVPPRFRPVGARNAAHVTRPADTRGAVHRAGRAVGRILSRSSSAGGVVVGERPGRACGVAGGCCSGAGTRRALLRHAAGW